VVADIFKMTKLFNKSENTFLRRKLRKNPTKAEKVFWIAVRNKKLNFRFVRQYSVGKYIADFCCPEKKLIIEIDGITHSDDRVIKNDLLKEKFLIASGFKVIRYSNRQVLNSLEAVINDLLSNLTRTSP
jgi:very-short-patch-repair endonuclease